MIYILSKNGEFPRSLYRDSEHVHNEEGQAPTRIAVSNDIVNLVRDGLEKKSKLRTISATVRADNEIQLKPSSNQVNILIFN